MQACRLRWLPKRSLRASPLSYRSFSTSHDESSVETFDVVCVGGGPAGLSLLAGLRASPITSELKIALVESQDLSQTKFNNTSPSTFSNRCSSLTPASVAHLQRIGAWQHVDHSRVQPYQEMEVWDGVTGSRISFEWATATPPFSQPPARSPIASMIENANLTAALQARLSALGSPTTFSPARVAHIGLGAPSAHGLDLRSWPTLTLSTGATLAARLLVGADGASSPVRAFAGVTARGWDYGRVGVVATLRVGERPPGAAAVAFQRFLPSGPVALLPLPGGVASLVWSTTPGAAARLRALGAADFAAMVDAAFRLPPAELRWLHGLEGGQAEEVAWRRRAVGVVDDVKMPPEVVGVQEGSVAAFPLRMRHADSYVAPRVALVGDAAHTIHPLAGQGLNQGQADVAALVAAIEEAVEEGQDVGSLFALERYNAERYAANNVLLGVCDKLHKLYSWESGPVVAARSLGLSAVDKMGFLKGFLMRMAAGA